MPSKKHDIFWLQDMFPTRIGFCPSKKAWDKHIKRHKVDNDTGYPHAKRDNSRAKFTRFISEGTARSYLITVDTDVSLEDVPGVLLHELQHCWWYIRREIGEDEPSFEMEAYLMQSWFDQLLSAFESSRGPVVQHGRQRQQ